MIVSACVAISGTKTNLISQALPLFGLLLVPHHVVHLAKEIEADVHTSDTDQYSITSSVKRSIIFSVNVGRDDTG